MATTTAPFKPTTDSFGHLTVKSRPVRRVNLPKNILIALSFLVAFGAGTAGLLAIDNAVFDNAQQNVAASSNMHLDYD